LPQLHTHLTNFLFDGAQVDLLKALSVDPISHVTHSFSLASQTAPSTYNFGARALCESTGVMCCMLCDVTGMVLMLCTIQILLQGSVNNEGNVNGRFNHGWSSESITKLWLQVRSFGWHARSIAVFTQPLALATNWAWRDPAGAWTTRAKTSLNINPSPMDASSTYVGSYLQSLTKNFAIGFDLLH
jgi:mitochondrial import receptor subunit TOM40